MKKVALESVLPGQKLAKSIYSIDGKILLEAGNVLSMQSIARLEYFNTKEIFVEDFFIDEFLSSEVISRNTRSEAKKIIRNVIIAAQDNDYKIVEYVVISIIDQLLLKNNIIENLVKIRKVDDYTFEHSVNVCVLSLIIGIKLGYSNEELMELGIGAILHDLGKLKIPENVLKKPSKLSDEEFNYIKKHANYGYELICQYNDIPKCSAEVALYHHERIDGSGYPEARNQITIPEYARITAVADVFDALTSDRVYRNKLTPKDALEYMTSNNIQHFDPLILEKFIALITIYPIGSTVLLNNGEKAVVLAFNKNLPTKPIVRIFKEVSCFANPNFYEIDLSENSNLQIVECCSVNC